MYSKPRSLFVISKEDNQIADKNLKWADLQKKVHHCWFVWNLRSMLIIHMFFVTIMMGWYRHAFQFLNCCTCSLVITSLQFRVMCVCVCISIAIYEFCSCVKSTLISKYTAIWTMLFISISCIMFVLYS